MKNYDRLTLNEVANTYRKMILIEASKPPPEPPLPPGKPWKPAHRFPPPVPGWYPVPYSGDNLGDPTGFPKDRRFITPQNPKGYWRWQNPDDGWSPGPMSPPKPSSRPQIPGIDQQIDDAMNRPTTTRKPTAAPRTPAPKPGARPIRGLRPAVGAAGAVGLGLNLWSIYQQLFGDDGVEVDVIPDDGQVIKPVNAPTPNLDLSPMQVPEHLRNPHSYPGQHPVRPPKAPAGGSQGSGGGSQGSGGGIGGGGGMGM